MFFGLTDPFAMIREELEGGLREQVPDTVVEAIRVVDEPKFLTIGRKTENPSQVIVAHYGVCLRTTVDVRSNTAAPARLDATLTFLFGNVDRRGQEKARTTFDLNADAAGGFNDDLFKQRFLQFRAELG
jgi:hypothetical protein